MSYICLNPKHLEIETDGTVYCQHCFYELRTKNERLRENLTVTRNMVGMIRQFGGNWTEALQRIYDYLSESLGDK